MLAMQLHPWALPVAATSLDAIRSSTENNRGTHTSKAGKAQPEHAAENLYEWAQQRLDQITESEENCILDTLYNKG